MKTRFFDVKRQTKSKRKIKNIYLVLFDIFALVTIFLTYNIRVNAANVHMGSASYQSAAGQDFNVGIYFEGSDNEFMGHYEAVITYDKNIVSYVSGANEGSDGRIVVSGDSIDGSRVRVMLTMHAEMGGDSDIKVESATIRSIDGADLAVDELPSVPIHIEAPLAEAPDYIALNGEKISGYSKTKNEYSFDVDYTDEMIFTAPEGYILSHDLECLQEGSNEVVLTVSQAEHTPIEYRLTINMASETDKDSSGNKVDEDSSEGNEDSNNSQDEEEKIEDQLSKIDFDIQDDVNDENSYPQRDVLKSYLILIGFGIIIIVIVLAKLLWDKIITNENSIKRDIRVGRGVIGTSESIQPNDMFDFADINSIDEMKKEVQRNSEEIQMIDLWGDEFDDPGRKG